MLVHPILVEILECVYFCRIHQIIYAIARMDSLAQLVMVIIFDTVHYVIKKNCKFFNNLYYS